MGTVSVSCSFMVYSCSILWMISLILQHSGNTIWHRMYQFLTVFWCYLGDPCFFDLFLKILCWCRVSVSHLSLHYSPNIFNDIEIRRAAWPRSKYLIASVMQPFCNWFCAMARCPIMLKICRSMDLHKVWKFVLKYTKINLAIDSRILRHDPQTGTSSSWYSAPYHDFSSLSHSWHHVFCVIALVWWSPNVPAVRVELCKGRLIREHNILLFTFGPVLVLLAKKQPIIDIFCR